MCTCGVLGLSCEAPAAPAGQKWAKSGAGQKWSGPKVVQAKKKWHGPQSGTGQKWSPPMHQGVVQCHSLPFIVYNRVVS